ncbi:MAG: hypothetical protein A3K46_06340 [Chloroflexi bacterium RBG_13_60_9]|nr:MAG: hypothetical protein A3K46_06340 [Chloroflexi bacterium RBG_13_60_9]
MHKPIHRFLAFSFTAFLWAAIALSADTALAAPRALPEFPQKNAWTRITPSVVWCGDETSTVTIEVHIVGRTDVRKVWVTDLDPTGEDASTKAFDDSSNGLEFFDDGTHGDSLAGDNIFTHSGLVLPCNEYMMAVAGWANWLGFLRVELADGTLQGNNYGIVAGQVDPKYKNAFAVRDLGSHLSATAYVFFIEDPDHAVIDNYPVANVYCGTTNYQAYRKLYSVLPDAFDIALVMPGMQIVRPTNFAENVPYDIQVSNAVQHTGLKPHNNTAAFGSSGRLKSIVYHSFGNISISTHEIGHTWGMHIGAPLGLMESWQGEVMLGHWNGMTDIGGQMSAYYFDKAGHVGHFHYNGDETWSLISNIEREPFSPIDLYVMGMIPPEEVPPIHILQSPNFTDPNRITAASSQTVTMDQVVKAEGGPRVPSAGESQKDFTLAFIVTQDTPFNDAAYAFFSLMSYNLMSKDPPDKRTFFTSFYWATGGRGTLNTRLPVDVVDPSILPGMPSPTPTATLELNPTMAADTPSYKPTVNAPLAETPAVETPLKKNSGSPLCNCPLLVGGLTILPGAWLAMRRKKPKL